MIGKNVNEPIIISKIIQFNTIAIHQSLSITYYVHFFKDR